MKSKYEQMIDYLVNEEHDLARQLFHSIVVENSRRIYESLIDEELNEMGGDMSDDFIDGISDDEHGLSMGDEDGGTAGDDDFNHDDDDFMDMDNDLGGDEEGTGEIEDRVVDLEDALAQLQQEFDSLSGDSEEAGEDLEGGDEFGAGEDLEGIDDDTDGMDDGDNFGNDDMDSDDDNSGRHGFGDDDELEESLVREYVERVKPKNTWGHSSEEAGTNTKSTTNQKTPNIGGGSNKNIVQGGESKGRPDPKSGQYSSHKFQNTPGNKAKLDKVSHTPNTSEKDAANKQSILKNR